MSQAEKIDRADWPKLIETATKAVIICYGLGYLIETIYSSVFGIFDLELIRTRALFCGVSYLFLIAIILLVSDSAKEWRFVSFYWRSLDQSILDGEHVPKSFRWLIWLAVRTAVAAEIAQFSVYLFMLIYLPFDRIKYEAIAKPDLVAATHEMHHKSIFFWILLQSICFVIPALIAPIFAHKFPRISATISVLFTILYLLITARSHLVPLGLLLWLFVIVSLIQWTKRPLLVQKSSKWRLGVLLGCLISTIMYARLVYPSVLPWLGGPPKSTVVITCEKSCSVSGREMRLIEETNDGYYVVPLDNQQADATFVARNQVKEIVFSSSVRLLVK